MEHVDRKRSQKLFTWSIVNDRKGPRTILKESGLDIMI